MTMITAIVGVLLVFAAAWCLAYLLDSWTHYPSRRRLTENERLKAAHLRQVERAGRVHAMHPTDEPYELFGAVRVYACGYLTSSTEGKP